MAVEVDGWRLGLGICKDTGAPRHIAATASLGVDAYMAGVVHRPDEVDEQEVRGFVMARPLGAWVVFAGFPGSTGASTPRPQGSPRSGLPTGQSSHGPARRWAGSCAVIGGRSAGLRSFGR